LEHVDCDFLFFFRTMATSLEIAAPLLMVYNNLEDHFEWICGGPVKANVNTNLKKEIKLLEQYLLSQNQPHVTSILDTYARECEESVYESGDTHRWVGVLRGAEQHWKTSDAHALFRTELEGINGSSPQLLITTRER